LASPKTIDLAVKARMDNYSNLFGMNVIDEEKKFYNFDTWSTFDESMRMQRVGVYTKEPMNFSKLAVSTRV
jgi:hypothetical protein